MTYAPLRLTSQVHNNQQLFSDHYLDVILSLGNDRETLRTEHERLTAEIVRLETELNERVYALYDLTPDEIKIIEDVTKYEYGEA